LISFFLGFSLLVLSAGKGRRLRLKVTRTFGQVFYFPHFVFQMAWQVEKIAFVGLGTFQLSSMLVPLRAGEKGLFFI